LHRLLGAAGIIWLIDQTPFGGGNDKAACDLNYRQTDAKIAAERKRTNTVLDFWYLLSE
jgi:hypothetical protein